jgi:hypothetical protein
MRPTPVMIPVNMGVFSQGNALLAADRLNVGV